MKTNNLSLLIIASLLFVLPLITKSQSDNQLIQFSGVVVEEDSLKPVPFVSVLIRNSKRGTVSDYFGYFSFVAQKNDTIDFSAIGYKRGYYVIPDTLSSNRYSLIQVLRTDTVFLKETVIYPWPTREQFKEAFLKIEVPDDDLERAKKNLARSEIKSRMDGLPVDGNYAFNNKMQQKYSQLYYAGQMPPNNLLNPIAWAKFIEAWKRGDFKNKDK